jgi:peroxiredoxin
MAKLSAYRVLILGLLSPVAAAVFGLFTYTSLTRASTELDKTFVFRLSATTLAMAVPFALTLLLAMRDRRRHALTLSGKVGLTLAVLSLALTWLPLEGLIGRMKQARNLARQDVPAPGFDTVDVFGKPHRLADHAGKVVLINAWGTWCPPCRTELPKLDALYKDRRDRGFVVFGVSTEEADVQRRFVEQQIPVSYPLLTIQGDVPDMYRSIERYPANFLIDRSGQLQRAPGNDEPFEKLEAAIDALLAGHPPTAP